MVKKRGYSTIRVPNKYLKPSGGMKRRRRRVKRRRARR